MVFAVGGNAEAARRAGVPVARIRIAVFAIASTLAAWGGVMASSRLLAVNQSAGSGDVLLDAIASAVIGGTSLFGGRGTVWAALLGILVIQSISNGMDLLSFEPAVKPMITGSVLLAAVTIDAIARPGREAGRPPAPASLPAPAVRQPRPACQPRPAPTRAPVCAQRMNATRSTANWSYLFATRKSGDHPCV